jgi:hypothetical protein
MHNAPGAAVGAVTDPAQLDVVPDVTIVGDGALARGIANEIDAAARSATGCQRRRWPLPDLWTQLLRALRVGRDARWA